MCMIAGCLPSAGCLDRFTFRWAHLGVCACFAWCTCYLLDLFKFLRKIRWSGRVVPVHRCMLMVPLPPVDLCVVSIASVALLCFCLWGALGSGWVGRVAKCLLNTTRWVSVIEEGKLLTLQALLLYYFCLFFCQNVRVVSTQGYLLWSRSKIMFPFARRQTLFGSHLETEGNI